MRLTEGQLFIISPTRFYINSVYKVIFEICGKEYNDPNNLVFKSGLSGGCLFSASSAGDTKSTITFARMSAEGELCDCEEDLAVESATMTANKHDSFFYKYYHDAWPKDVWLKDVFKTYLSFLHSGIQNVVNGRRAKIIVWNKGTPTIKEQETKESCSDEDFISDVPHVVIESTSGNCPRSIPNGGVVSRYGDTSTNEFEENRLIRNDVPHALKESHDEIAEGASLKYFDEYNLDVPCVKAYSEIEDLTVEQFPHVVSFIEDRQRRRDILGRRNVQTASARLRGPHCFDDELMDVSIPRRSLSQLNMYSSNSCDMQMEPQVELHDNYRNNTHSNDSVTSSSGFDMDLSFENATCHEDYEEFENRQPERIADEKDVSNSYLNDNLGNGGDSILDLGPCQDSKCGPPGCEGQKCGPCSAHLTDESGKSDGSTFMKNMKDELQKMWTSWIDQIYESSGIGRKRS